MTQSFHCPNCGAPLDPPGGDAATLRCPFCQSSIIIPAELRDPDSSETLLSAGEAFALLPNLAGVVQRVAELTRSGQKIEAIRLFREQFGIGLKQAKDAVEQIERGEVVHLTNLAVTSSSGGMDAAHFAEVARLVREGNKIEAIKRFRELTGLGLKESKDAVEALERSGALGAGSSAPGTSTITVNTQAVGKVAKTAAAVTGGVSCLVLSILVAVALFTVGTVLFALMSPGGPLEEVALKNNPLAADRVIASFGAEGSGQGLLQDPRSIAVGANDDLFVADYSTGRVQRFDAQGNFLSLWLLGDEPIITAMDSGPDGVVYVAYGGDIHRFDAASGSSLGLLPNPEDRYYEDIRVMADGGLVVVANGETLLRFDSRGELAWVVEDAVSTASGDSELDARVAADGLGNLYMLGSFNDGVFKFDPQGKFVTRWGSPGEEDGQFRAVNAIAVDGQGRVYVSDIRGIQVFENDGRYIRTIRDIGVTFGMDFDSQGRLWIATNAPKVFAYQVGQ